MGREKIKMRHRAKARARVDVGKISLS